MADDHVNDDAAQASVERTGSESAAELAGPVPRSGERAAERQSSADGDSSGAERQGSADGDSSGGSQDRRRTIALCAAFAAMCAVLALSIFSIVRDQERRGGSVPAESRAEGQPALEPNAPTTAAGTGSTGPVLEKVEVPPSEFVDETDDGEPGPATKSPPKRYDTVQQAAAESCSTASIDELSRQIIEQARCIKPNAFALLPARPNLVLSPNVYPYLELEARNHVLRALEANPSGKMTVNSALRTVAQQYLVSRWAAGKRCGVQLATPPGESNHEIGAALDIAEPARWRSALEQQGFRWLGTSDRVHFDYKAHSDGPTVATDVLAFQVLWNRNHPEDTVPVDGRYSPATERRLRRAPAGGFRAGPTCRNVATPKRP